MSPQSSRALAATFAGLGLIGALAACSAPAGTDTGADTGNTAATPAAPTPATQDGTYTADGSYQAPSGAENITVELTLADDIVTDVTVTPHATDPTAKGMQANFAGGIADQVVGQDIDTLNVSRVAGSFSPALGSRPPSRRSRQTRWPEACRSQAVWTFEAIGAPWRIDTPDELSDSQREAVTARIEAFDRDWSRFRDDSLVTASPASPDDTACPPTPGPCGLVPRALRRDSRSRSPLVGRTLESLGYDAAYRLTPAAQPVPVPSWADAMAWDGSTSRPPGRCSSMSGRPARDTSWT